MSKDNRTSPVDGYTRGCTTPHISHAPIASFIARDCACCSDQPTVPPDCPACHGVGGFTRIYPSTRPASPAPAAQVNLSNQELAEVRTWLDGSFGPTCKKIAEALLTAK